MVIVSVTSDGEVMLPFISRRLQKVPRGINSSLDQESRCWKILRLTTMFWAMLLEQKNPVLALGKFYKQITPKIWLPNLLDCNPLDNYMWVAVEREPNKTSGNTKDDLPFKITAAFTNLNKEIVGKAFRRLWSHLEALDEANCGFFE